MRYLALRPTLSEYVLDMPRGAQVIYPKDLAIVMFWADIFPGARVLEAGMGSGALTLALLRSVGPEGKVVSYEQREDFCRRALANIHLRMGEVTNLAVRLRPVEEGLAEEEPVDRAVFDLPEPWRLVDPVARVLRSGGIFLSYVPTIIQSHQLSETLRRHPGYAARRDLRDAPAALEHRRHLGAAVPPDGRPHRISHGRPARRAGRGPCPAGHRRARGRLSARSLLRAPAARRHAGRRDPGRPHHVHGDGLHHLREPGHPVVRGHPALQGQGPPFAAVQAATCLVAGIMTIAMGLASNYPLALAAGMGLNAAVAFQLIAGLKLPWQAAMGVVFLEGIILTVLVLTGLREAIMDAIPLSLKRAIGVGIGLFILFIGLVSAGIVKPGPPGVPVTLGELTAPPVAVALFGLFFTLWLQARRVGAGLLVGILATTALAIAVNAWTGGRAFPLPGQARPAHLGGRPSRFLDPRRGPRPLRLRARRASSWRS